MRKHTQASILTLLLCLTGCASGSQDEAVVSRDDSTGDGDGDGDDSTGDGDDDSAGDGDDDSSGDVYIESVDTDEGETLRDEDMIDDLEDHDDAILAQGGRVGSWYTFHDDESPDAEQTPGDSFVPSAGGGDDSKYAALTEGKGYKAYAGLAFDLNNDGEELRPYDVSKFKGISFLARGNVDLRVGIATLATVNSHDGGECAAGDDECDDTHGVDITADTEWGKFDIPFSKIRQEGWGQAAEFDPKSVLGVTFSVPEGATFEFAIDDVGFY